MANNFTTGSITTSTGTLSVGIQLNKSALIDISGTYTSFTFVIEGSSNGGSSYFPLAAVNNALYTLSTGTLSPSNSTKNSWLTNTVGLTHLQVRATGLASGSVTVGIEETDASFLESSGPLTVIPLGSGSTTSSTQGTAAALSGAWPVELTDGTTGPVFVTPASTAALATNPALVVSLSPNSPITFPTTSLAKSTALASSLVVKAAAGTLITIDVSSTNAVAQFIKVHNTTTLPADTAVPALVFNIAGTGNLSIHLPITGIPLSTGITLCNSTTAATKTIGAADCFFSAVYI